MRRKKFCAGLIVLLTLVASIGAPTIAAEKPHESLYSDSAATMPSPRWSTISSVA